VNLSEKTNTHLAQLRISKKENLEAFRFQVSIARFLPAVYPLAILDARDLGVANFFVA
jgi:hypothetical protein